MRNHLAWLAEQLEQWLARGIISVEQAARIRALYPEPGRRAPWGAIVFSGIGAAVIGFGIILLFAYNWHAIPKAGKLGIVFGSLLAAHAAGVMLMRATDWRCQLGEAVSLLGTMLFGAGIWLVAQIYNIDEHYPTGFLIWGVGVLIMAWALRSVVQGILASAVLTVWLCCEAGSFERAVHWGPFLLIAGTGSLAWLIRSRVLLIGTLAGFVIGMVATTISLDGYLVLRTMTPIGVVLVCLGVVAGRQTRFAAGGHVLAFFGWLAFCICLYVLTFKDATHPSWYAHEVTGLSVSMYRWVSFAAALAACAAAVVPLLAAMSVQSEAWPIENWILPIAVIYLQIVASISVELVRETAFWPFNLLFLTLALAWMVRGCQRGMLVPTTLGSLMFAALALARYFDLFESLLTRGIVFVLVGALIFTEGLLYMRARRTRQREEVVS